MAKYKIRYPNGAEVTKYITTEIGKVERTSGRSKVLNGAVKPYVRVGKIVLRFPGVTRRSERVRAVNAVLEAVAGSAEHPAIACAGKPWKQFLGCMSRQLSDVMSQTYDVRFGKERPDVVNWDEWVRTAYGSTPAPYDQLTSSIGLTSQRRAAGTA